MRWFADEQRAKWYLSEMENNLRGHLLHAYKNACDAKHHPVLHGYYYSDISEESRARHPTIIAANPHHVVLLTNGKEAPVTLYGVDYETAGTLTLTPKALSLEWQTTHKRRAVQAEVSAEYEHASYRGEWSGGGRSGIVRFQLMPDALAPTGHPPKTK